MDPLKKFERIVKIALIVMLVVSVSLVSAWLLSAKQKDGYDVSLKAGEQNEVSTNTKLTGKMDLLPDKCTLNMDLSKLSFVKEDGGVINLSSLKGKTVILNFWASWCPYCSKELEQWRDIRDQLSQYSNVELLLVNKLDNDKETKAQALDYLKKNQIPFENVYDENLTVYNQLGLKVIPTTLVIDERGLLRAWHAGKDMNPKLLKSMIDYAVRGGDYATFNFLEKEMINKDGGVRTNYIQEKVSDLKYTDVLSESQGLLMEYAVNTANKILFEKSFKYVNENMRDNSLTAWVVTDKGPAKVNSTLDDLRILRALCNAEKLWGGYTDTIKNYEGALYRYNTHRQNLINQYDFKYRKKSDSLKLCFADFEAMQYLADLNPRWKEIYANSLAIVNAGYIGDGFPVYYPEYVIAKKTYKKEDINMAEGMVTLLHLAKIGQLKPQTLEWLKTAVEGEGIYARYKIDGTVADGYNYESTAIYGLVSMIAASAGDKDLANRAQARMETMRVFDSDNKVNGAFGNADGTGIYSFDQCIALLSYSVAGKNTR